MRLTIVNETEGLVFETDVGEDLTLPDLKAYLGAETGLEHFSVVHNLKTLSGDSAIAQLGVKANDLLVLKALATPVDPIEGLRLQVLQDPRISTMMENNYPTLARKVNDPAGFRAEYFKVAPQNDTFSTQSQEETRRLEQHEDDPESQRRILEIIQQQRIEENLQLAYDISPELFVPVTMLYIKLKIKGQPVFALVDSGAQTTIILPEIADKCGISHLIDKRYSQKAQGIGITQTKGRIHSVPVSIGDSSLEIPCSFSVIDVHVGILFGLDMLRRHKCSIDLSRDALVIGDTETKFLSEAEVENLIPANGK